MRKIKLKGANNARDFGGIVNKEGKTIKEGCFLRSERLSDITDTDASILFGRYNLRTVIDLRTTVEKTDDPDKEMYGVRNFHIPLFPEEVMGITHENNIDKRKMLDDLPDLKGLYRTLVLDPNCVPALRKVFEVITSAKEGEAVLWHCTEGKDRCGLVSALFLFLLDVDKDTVIEDYLLTNEAAEKRARKYSRLVRYLLRQPEKADIVYDMYRAKKEYLDNALDSIEEAYGSIDNFLRDQLGISDETKARMKERYLTKDNKNISMCIPLK